MLRRLLVVVFALFTLLAVNAGYLAGVTFLEWLNQATYQGYVYQLNFLLHLGLGLLFIPLSLMFALPHLKRAWRRSNRSAARLGLALFGVGIVLIISGLALIRFDFFALKDSALRQMFYWLHAATPLLVVGLFVWHRFAGKHARWRAGMRWVGFAGGIALALILVHVLPAQRADDTQANRFFPALSRTAHGGLIAAEALMKDEYCRECHADSHRQWAHSAHRFSSFNNPAYKASVRETREVLLKRDGHVQASRFCAGCHDPVPLFAGLFDDPGFADGGHPSAEAGITCSVCHAVTVINSPRGNADFTIAAPTHYPFAFSDSVALRWLSRQLIKAKPAFHKKTFLKPLHRTAEFCGACHKVHLPEVLNGYRWLRGQNHYDAFLLSGVSGHGVSSFYYPEQAAQRCAACHMPLEASDDFGAQRFADADRLSIHNHQFAAANTALAHLLRMPDWVNTAHREVLKKALRVDIFALQADDGLHAPLRPDISTLNPGQSYRLDIVLRTLTLGHVFTQGTADSNQVWLDVKVTSGDRVIAHSGGLQAPEQRVDPAAHFVNAYMLDRDGQRIDRRNAQDIFVPLYNNQIPPGAADTVHYRLHLPADIDAPVTITARLHYRKFDTTYMRYFQGDDFVSNDLPITTIATDAVTFPLTEKQLVVGQTSAIPTWQRWNDYGIGLLRKHGAGELRQAEQAFQQVEALGHADGALNLARGYLREGRLGEAAAALTRAALFDPPAYPWTVEWFTGLVNKQNGFLDAAIENFRRIAATDYPEARRRGFDFSRDYRLLNELGQTLFERAKRERGETRREHREALLHEALEWFNKTLAIDPENAMAHYNLALVYARLGDSGKSAHHRAMHARYKPDDNAQERAVNIHRRRNPIADHAAADVVVYELVPPNPSQ